MRVYTSTSIKNDAMQNKLINKLEPYFYESRTKSHIVTRDGLLQMVNNRLYRLGSSNSNDSSNSSNSSNKKTIIGVFPITIKDEPSLGEECYQIPPASEQKVFIHRVYKLSDESAVEWIFVYNNNNVLQEYYFSLPDGTDINQPDVKADILTFLS